MNASIHDEDALKAIGIGELSSYLRTTGWRIHKQLSERATLWRKNSEKNAEEEFEVLVPQKTSFDDYVLRIAQALQTLAFAEQRSELALYRDILQTQMDTVRLRFRSSQFEEGTVPLRQATILVEQAREMVLAAACATIEPRAYYHKRKPDKAMEYLEKVRLGQTENGSFVLTLQTPVPPLLRTVENQESSLFTELEEEPFERRVTMMLASSVQAASNAVILSMSTGDFSPFQAALGNGVNANLCDALANMGLETSAHSIAIGFHWSPARPQRRKHPHTIELTQDHFQMLRVAAREFREHASIDDFELIGTVIRLEREQSTRGMVTLSGFVDSTLRRVKTVLDDENYQMAIQAHSSRELVSCTGELIKAGRSYTLSNPRKFTILDDPFREEDEEALALR